MDIVEKNGVKVIYDMPFDEYRAVEALSYSGIKEICISMSDYLTPKDETESMSKTIGKAYHTAILEGKECFDELYCGVFEAPDECLKTIDDMKAYLDLNVVSYKGVKVKNDFISLCQSVDADVLIYDELKEDHYKGRTVLPNEVIEKILAYQDLIEKSGKMQCLQDAKKEVSIFWTENNIPMKARLDALVSSGIFDLKTFDNSRRSPIDKAVNNSIMQYGYHVQADMYLRAYSACRLAGIEGFENEEPYFAMLFLQTNAGLNVRFRALSKHEMHCETILNDADYKIRHARELYKMHVIDKKPVIHNFAVDFLMDAEVPAYFFN